MSYSPYVSSFNNPIYYTDPTGMLPSGYSTNSDYYTDYYDDGTGKVIYDPNVNGPGDVPSGGSYIGTTYTDPTTGTFWDENGNPHNNTQTTNEIVVVGGSSSNKQVNFTIWGLGSGTSGNKGTTNHSINHDDITYGGGGGKANNALARLLKYINNLFSTAGNMKKVKESIILKPNETTMEKKVEEEAKNVPDTVTYQVRFYGKYRYDANGKRVSHWYTEKGKHAADSLAAIKWFGYYGENVTDSVSVVKKY
jgi:hypothetical protein